MAWQVKHRDELSFSGIDDFVKHHDDNTELISLKYGFIRDLAFTCILANRCSRDNMLGPTSLWVVL